MNTLYNIHTKLVIEQHCKGQQIKQNNDPPDPELLSQPSPWPKSNKKTEGNL